MKLKCHVTPHQLRLEWLKSEWEIRNLEGIKDLLELEFIKQNQEFGKIPTVNICLSQDIPVMNQELITKILLIQFRHKIINKLPDNIQWSLYGVSEIEFRAIRPMCEDTWHKAFAGAAHIGDIARMIENGLIDDYGHVKKIRAIQKDIQSGKVFNEKLICISTNEPKSKRPSVSLIEGNHRAVAFELEYTRTFRKFRFPSEIIIGTSDKMKECCWYNY